MKDNYRQLKFVMDKNWNYTEGNSFFAKEMYYYFQSLSFFKIKEVFKKVLLLIQWFISYFWNYWFVPFLWILLFWLVLTWFKLNNFSYFKIEDMSNYYNENFWNLFFTNINPFDKSLFTTNWITWRNFLHKIILVILYWHLVVALKRTTKR
jgi:hypothetical protein